MSFLFRYNDPELPHHQIKEFKEFLKSGASTSTVLFPSVVAVPTTLPEETRMVSRSVQNASTIKRRRETVKIVLVIVCASFFRLFELPAEIVVVDHVFGHADINTNILAHDETSFIGREEQNHVRDIERIADTTGEVLRSIRSGIRLERGVDPARRNRIDANTSCKACGKGVRKRGNAAFGRSVALRLRLAHPVA